MPVCRVIRRKTVVAIVWRMKKVGEVKWGRAKENFLRAELFRLARERSEKRTCVG